MPAVWHRRGFSSTLLAVRRYATLGAALLVAISCRTMPVGVPLGPQDPRPAAMLAAWAEEAGQRRALRGRARLAVDGAEGRLRLRGRQNLALERPARLRVEILGFLDATLAVLTTDGEHFELFRAEDHSFESGRVDPGLLWEQAHLDLSPAEAVGVLLGAPPAGDLRPVAAWGFSDGRIRIELADAAGRVHQRLGFDSEARLRSIEVLAWDGELAWRAEFDEYALVDGIPFAHAISLDVSRGGTHAEISLRDVELNPSLPPGLFQLRGLGAERGAAGESG